MRMRRWAKESWNPNKDKKDVYTHRSWKTDKLSKYPPNCTFFLLTHSRNKVYKQLVLIVRTHVVNSECIPPMYYTDCGGGCCRENLHIFSIKALFGCLPNRVD